MPEEILLHPADDYVEAFVKDVNRDRALTVEIVMRAPAYRITAITIQDAIKQMKGCHITLLSKATRVCSPKKG